MLVLAIDIEDMQLVYDVYAIRLFFFLLPLSCTLSWLLYVCVLAQPFPFFIPYSYRVTHRHYCIVITSVSACVIAASCIYSLYVEIYGACARREDQCA